MVHQSSLNVREYMSASFSIPSSGADDAGVQLDRHRSADDLAEEATGISRVAGGFGCWAFTVGGHAGAATQWPRWEVHQAYDQRTGPPSFSARHGYREKRDCAFGKPHQPAAPSSPTASVPCRPASQTTPEQSRPPGSHASAIVMTETTTSAAPPKKRTLFKRPAVRAAAKNEEADIFSHSNEFSDIVALEEKQRAEAKKRAEASRDRKRRRISSDNQEAPPPNTGSDKKAQASRASSKARGGTPLSPAPAQSPPASLAARYDSLAKSASSSTLLPTKDSHVISLDDSDDDDDDDSGHVSKPLFDESAFDRKPSKADFTQDIAVRPSVAAPVLIEDDDEEPEEGLGPEHAALQARIRARLADRKNRKPSTAPITELLITSDIPDTTPLRVKVRVDTLIEKPRKAWCEKQNFPAKFADDVFFTWNRTRIYDSTSIARLGIKAILTYTMTTTSPSFM
ncbi:hypothetical protein TW65_03985 [Stemphylium lycopersici]|nr:hypothetical protein TW65_03985 [Stemphylium lycopersici]